MGHATAIFNDSKPDSPENHVMKSPFPASICDSFTTPLRRFYGGAAM
jgi:hypothetical protein